MKTQDLFRVQEQLLLAAGGELPFTRVIDTVISAFDGAGGVVFELNRKNGAISNWCGNGLEAGEDDYIHHINSINPRMHYSMRHAAGHLCYEGKFIDDRSMDRHEFYSWLSNVEQLRYFIGSRVFDEGDVSLFTSVEFVKKQGHAETEKIEAFRRIAPSIGSAWRIAKRSSNGTGGTESHSWTPDHLPWSIFAVDLNASIVQMNRSARQMLNAGKVLCVEDGTLRPKDRQARVRFEQAMTQAMRGVTSEALLSTGNGAPPLAAQFLPVNPGRLAHPSPVSVLVYVWNPLENAVGLGRALERLYGLTAAEGQIAEQLATGAELSSAAASLGISRNTARNHLQQVFAKTGTHRQGEFLTRILGVLRN
ncbi:MAG: helix-turn-helix transcriptional regulator [Rhizobiales bacterium]|nr:helix-turn-helix transcriptional regulator [Hyphomicrobiales bacterium]